MRRRSLILALIAASVAGGPVCSLAAGVGFGPGGPVYDRYCANCHGADGFPNLPGTPDFTRGESLEKTDPELIDAIRFGVRSMPGFDQTIDKEGLFNVVMYIRSLQR
jgi:mono/diheme cytochrome c family protein